MRIATLQVALLLTPALAAQRIDLFGLTQTQDFEVARTSSTNPDLLSNDDAKRPIPGETLVLADLSGPGVITHIWITSSNNEYGWPRLFRLRVFYDGSAAPSVDAPVGDFFGSGHGLERDLHSQMVRVSSSGRSRNSYWPMPFRKACRITVTNEGRQRPNSFYYQVDWKRVPSLPPDTLYFHAHYRQAIPAKAGALYELLDIKGRGHYVGTVFSVLQTQAGWFGEGDESFFVDGAAEPTLHGTGTEDYFGDAYELHVSDGAYAGTTIADGAGLGARMTAYRWHIPDPIPFRRSLRLGFEHAGFVLNGDGSVKETFAERPDFFSSVAFWYQEGVAVGLPYVPYGSRRLPHGNARRIAGAARTFEVDHDGRYEVSAIGAGKVSVDGGPAWADLRKGTHRLDPSSTVEAFIVAEVGSVPAEPEEAVRLRRIGQDRNGPPAEMKRGLASPDAEVRQAAAWALGQFPQRAAGATAELAESLRDGDPIVRGLAALGLREAVVAEPGHIAGLIHGLKDSDSSVRLMCAAALGRAKAAAAVPGLIELAQTPNEELHVLRNVVYALGEIGPPAEAALAALEALKTNPRLRYPAAAAQKKIKPGPVPL